MIQTGVHGAMQDWDLYRHSVCLHSQVSMLHQIDSVIESNFSVHDGKYMHLQG